MGDLEALFGDLGDVGGELKMYGVIAAGAVAGKMTAGWALNILDEKMGPVLGSYQKLALSAVEVGLGIAAARYLPKAFHKVKVPAEYGSWLTTGVAIGLVADGLVGVVKEVAAKFAPSMAPGFIARLPGGLGDTAQDVLFQRYLAAAPTSVEQLQAAPTSVELAAAPSFASTLTG